MLLNYPLYNGIIQPSNVIVRNIQPSNVIVKNIQPSLVYTNYIHPSALEPYLTFPPILMNTLYPVIATENVVTKYDVTYNSKLPNFVKIYKGSYDKLGKPSGPFDTTNVEIYNDFNHKQTLLNEIENVLKAVLQYYCNSMSESDIINFVMVTNPSIKKYYGSDNDNVTLDIAKDNIIYDENFIKIIIYSFKQADFQQLCKGVKLINGNQYLDNNYYKYNINVMKGGDNCFNVDLIKVLNRNKLDNSCECYACNKYNIMDKYLKKSINNNNFNGVLLNLIPSFVEKKDYCLLFKLSKPYMESKNKKLNFFY